MTLARPAAAVLVALLAACATRPVDVITVHVFANQPDHPEITAIAEQLKAAGYRHRIRYSETPGGLEIGETLVVHGDSAAAYNRALDLAEFLSTPVHSPRVKREAHGNHQFSARNLGLYIYLPGAERAPELKVRAHLAGSCGERPVDLFLRVDHSYRLERQAWERDYTLVGAGHEGGDWRASGSGYRLRTDSGAEWWLEPPLDTDPADQVYFIRHHPEFDGCRLAEPL